jgi:hypothetical protein
MAVNASSVALGDDSAVLTLAIIVLLFVGAFFASWLVVGLTLCRDQYLVRHMHSSVSSYFSYTKYHRYCFFVVLIVLLCIISTLSAVLVWDYRNSTEENAEVDNISLGVEVGLSAFSLLLLFPVNAAKNGQRDCCTCECLRTPKGCPSSSGLHMVGGLAVLILLPVLELYVYSNAIINLGKDTWTNVFVVGLSAGQIVLALVFFVMMAFDMGIFPTTCCPNCRKGYRRGAGELAVRACSTNESSPAQDAKQPLTTPQRVKGVPLKPEKYADVDDLKYLGPDESGVGGPFIFAEIEENEPGMACFYVWKVWVEYTVILLNIAVTALLNLKKIALFDDDE